MIETVQIVSVPASDQERAKNFCVDTLGFEVRQEAPCGDGVRWIEVALQGFTPSLTLVIWFESMPPARSRVSWWPRATSGQPTKSWSLEASLSTSHLKRCPAGPGRCSATATAWCSGNGNNGRRVLTVPALTRRPA